jgi:fructose-bisphosphate aldolase class I
VIPFLKVDKGLQPEKDGVQLMKPLPDLAALLDKGKTKHIFGTKMRSVIQRADPSGIKNIVQQQFEVAGWIINTGLVPIIEPEVDIHCPQRAKAEALLKETLLEKLNGLPTGQQVMLKLTLPEQADFYADCVRHPKVVRVLALSGGYTQEEADARLRKNQGVVASFSRALLEGLSVHQTDAEFNSMLDASVQRIYEASIT